MSTKRKAATKLAMPVSRPAKKTTKFSIDESRTAITAVDSVPSTKPTETIEISSDSSESEYDVSNAEDDDDDDEEEEEEEEEEDAEASKQSQPTNPDAKDKSLIPNGTSHHHEDEEMHDATAKDDSEGEEKEEEDDDADAAPTFGDLVRANEPIDVPSGLAPQSTLTHHSGRAIATPSLSSLGTVLTQALRTDDSDLLESCFAVADITTVRNTIQRLDSGLAGLLLTKLAARLHRRPGRAGTLMGWVQWTLVAHGGALAAQPDLVKKLTDLNRVLEERARGLGSLLALKGKLDMLESQMNLRRATRKLQLGNEEDEEDEDDRVVYVAGDNAHGTDDEVDVDDDDALVMVNGVGEESDSGEEEEESDEANEEEQSAGEEEVYEDEVVHDDVDSEEEEDSDFAEAVAPPAKMQKTSVGFSRRR